MSSKIATILDDAKELTSLEHGSNINIYGKYDDNWILVDEFSYSLKLSIPISDIRDNIRTVILKLEDCKIIIGKTVSGLSYNIFDRMGFQIFEAESISETLLDEIISDVAEYTNGKVNPSSKISTSPIQTEIEGNYFLNLIKLQEEHPEISSKKALQSFFETTSFYKLELICSHVPPWFENYLHQKKLIYNVEEFEKNKYKVTIYKKVCLS